MIFSILLYMEQQQIRISAKNLGQLALSAEEVVRLLKVVREMVDQGVMPQGNGDCQDCRQLGEVLGPFATE